MAPSERLAVDPIACRAHGLSAERLPDLVRLEEWGYPILDVRPLRPEHRRRARVAVKACPTLALRLRRD